MGGQEEGPREAFIAGAWRETASRFPVVSPVDGTVVAEVSDCGPAEAHAAIAAAEVASGPWAAATAYERAQVLRRWFEAIGRHREDLARTMAREMGKPVSEGRAEVDYAAGFVEWYAEEAKRVYGTVVPSQFAGKRLWVRPEPVGIVYGITPWNFPAAMVTRKAAPALAAGCPFILKPAEESPLTALWLARLWEEAGGPPGTLQVLPARDPEALSRPFFEDARVRKLTFTGSTAVGRALYAQAAPTLKHVSLELGGQAPFLVFEDADIPRAVEEAMRAKFRNIGQSCVAANRLYVHRAVAAEFVRAYTARVQALKTGDPLAEDTQVGPLVNRQALEKVAAHVADALQRGATLVTGGAAQGLIYLPTVLTGVDPASRILHEETFGPVAPVVVFDQEEEAVAWANATEYGLAAGVFTRDVARAHRMAAGFQAGTCFINAYNLTPVEAPFGGM
ncbi:MAG: NAD-dependent succinate-semialdehyde dehydrogenase, partial [Firmicutes bacterium]|nr:NAD-dependent succinate-semialdehyde dehydrogenase [Bacillota bacterium]